MHLMMVAMTGPGIMVWTCFIAPCSIRHTTVTRVCVLCSDGHTVIDIQWGCVCNMGGVPVVKRCMKDQLKIL